ncbi:hypothetical protein VSDG_07225 [Cytospora chrysosperma]|uniref:Thiamine-triphosphatase n=1 Tax=Cytospora chrysosperma TaxID=252740 RepID=A0A423VMN5_CYTCH|nr:hypothetical protein VSDG_07225 [Valsa sordida]
MMMKAARSPAKVVSSISSRRLVGSMLLVSPRAFITRPNTPLATKRPSSQVSALGLVHPSTPGSPLRTMPPSTLEIERKFAPTATSMQQLANNTGTPPFESLIHHSNTSFEDAYYDTMDEVLCNAGVWLRRRGDNWEAKIRVGGDFTNSAFEEITNVDDISAMLGKLVPGTALDPNEGLVGGQIEEVAKLVTHRNKFLADGKFTVVLDETDFGHVVGEIELEREASVTGGGEEGVTRAEVEKHKRARAQVIAEMDGEINNFMKRYVWAFPPGNPMGKLSAYFEIKKQQK